jgi:ATPase components of ABC transporters with duplicated ATPase domains
MRTFLAFTGVKGSGKTTAFNIIRSAYPEVVEVTLAAKLKDSCAEVFSITRTAFDDPAIKEKDMRVPVYLSQSNVEAVIKSFGFTPDFDKHVRQHIGTVLESPRRVAQYIGTEVLRTVSEHIHCEGATMALPNDGVFVVTDMRFPNEFSFFQEQYPDSFYPLYVANYAAEAGLGPNPHASEKYVLELAKKCERIDNNGTIEEYQARVLSKVREILDRAGFARRQS